MAEYTGATIREIVTRVAAMMLRPYSDDPTADADLQFFMVNSAILQIARLHDFRGLQTSWNSEQIDANDREVPLPPRYKNRARLYWRDGTERKEIRADYDSQPITLEWILQHYPDPAETADAPLYYTIWGEHAIVVPTLSAAVDLELHCNCLPASITGEQRNWFTENMEDGLTFAGAALGAATLGEDAAAVKWGRIGGPLISDAIRVDAGEQVRRTGPVVAKVAYFDPDERRWKT
jgi:hypothetical protein